jgi:hypothetical protein
VARPNHARQVNWRNPLPVPARANRCQEEEEEVRQELAYEEGANYDDEELEEDYVAKEEEECEEVKMEQEEEEQELPEPPMNDLVAVMAQQTRLLEALIQDQQGRPRTPAALRQDFQNL